MSMETHKHLELIGLPSDATPSRSDVRVAYRRAMRSAHPDVGGSDAKASAINAALERLLDPEPEPDVEPEADPWADAEPEEPEPEEVIDAEPDRPQPAWTPPVPSWDEPSPDYELGVSPSVYLGSLARAALCVGIAGALLLAASMAPDATLPIAGVVLLLASAAIRPSLGGGGALWQLLTRAAAVAAVVVVWLWLKDRPGLLAADVAVTALAAAGLFRIQHRHRLRGYMR